MFGRQPSMDQAAIDALVAGEVDKSKAQRELALRNAGAVVQRTDRERRDALSDYERAVRRLDLAARQRQQRLGVPPRQRGLCESDDPLSLPELPELPELPGLLESSRQMEERMRPEIEKRRLALHARFEWFGARWDSPICHVNPRRRELPRGRCFHCDARFAGEDQGLVLVQSEPEAETFFHRKCFPAWMKKRRLPLDLGEALVAIGEERVVRASARAASDRDASAERIRAVEEANAPGDAWESPSWEEP